MPTKKVPADESLDELPVLEKVVPVEPALSAPQTKMLKNLRGQFVNVSFWENGAEKQVSLAGWGSAEVSASIADSPHLQDLLTAGFVSLG